MNGHQIGAVLHAHRVRHRPRLVRLEEAIAKIVIQRPADVTAAILGELRLISFVLRLVRRSAGLFGAHGLLTNHMVLVVVALVITPMRGPRLENGHQNTVFSSLHIRTGETPLAIIERGTILPSELWLGLLERVVVFRIDDELICSVVLDSLATEPNLRIERKSQ